MPLDRLVSLGPAWKVLGAFALVGAGVFAAVSAGGWGRPGTVVVPSLVGLGRSDAEERLEKVVLRWRYAGDRRVRSKPISGAAPFPALPPGRAVIGTTYVLPSPSVVAQRPRPGTRVRRKSVVVFRTRGGTAWLVSELAKSRERVDRFNRRARAP